jgi:hypothetical protein
MTWPFADRWDRALTYEQFVKESKEHCQLWTGVYRMARIPDWAIDRVAALGEQFRVMVLAEDWCGDASNSVPVLAKWAELAPNVELRILRRDEHPEVMDRYLTDGARSIPVAVLLTHSMEELGSWGPRPAELQALVMEQRRAGRTKQDYYPDVRRWYAKDRGATMLRDVLEVMERSGVGAHSHPS